VKTTKEGIEVKIHDQQAALVNVGKHLGMFVDKLEVKNTTLEDIIRAAAAETRRAMLATRSAPAPAARARVAARGRAARDYARWARRCYRIRDKQGRIRPFVLNSGQRRVGEIEREELATKGECRGFILKARQGGFSTDQQARALHQIWSQPNFDALTLAHTKEDTEKLFGDHHARDRALPAGRSSRAWATRRRARSPSRARHAVLHRHRGLEAHRPRHDAQAVPRLRVRLLG
jgi:hypothetical protein